MLITLNALGKGLSPCSLQQHPRGRNHLIPLGPPSQLLCLAAVTVTGKRTRTFLLRVMEDFNKYDPAEGQAVGRLSSGGLRLSEAAGEAQGRPGGRCFCQASASCPADRATHVIYF